MKDLKTVHIVQDPQYKRHATEEHKEAVNDGEKVKGQVTLNDGDKQLIVFHPPLHLDNLLGFLSYFYWYTTTISKRPSL